MKILIDVKDEQAAYLWKLLNDLPYVNEVKQITGEKAQLMSDFREALENLKLVEEGKMKSRPAIELLDEL